MVLGIIIYLRGMLHPLFRILVLGALGYGVYRMVPVALPPVKEALENSGVTNGVILGETIDYVNKILGNDPDETEDLEGGSSEEINKVVDELVSKTKDAVTEKVVEDVDKAKEGVNDMANEQFCKTILKTLEEDCGKFYCSE